MSIVVVCWFTCSQYKYTNEHCGIDLLELERSLTIDLIHYCYLLLLYLSYNFLYKNQLDSFTIFPGLCREVYLTGQYSFQLFDRHLQASKVRDLRLLCLSQLRDLKDRIIKVGI